jgi:tellurite resistance protein TerC
MPVNETFLFVAFNAVVLALLALDLGVFHRKDEPVRMREALVWSFVWIGLSLLFNAGVWTMFGPVRALEFLAGYLVEKSLSVDNIFVFVLLFTYFGTPAKYQHKILFWGIIGALIMRSIFIGVGAALIARFEWILYIFGVVLVVSGWKMFGEQDMEVHPDRNVIIRFVRKVFPVVPGYETDRFFVRRNGRLHLTQMLIVLLTVETTDVVFAVDSIPAVFGVTRDPFIVYSSNVCAILGLRSLYFVLAGMMQSFAYLSHGLALILIFIGLKMLAEPWYHIPIGLSLSVVGIVLTVAVVASLLKRRAALRRRT